MDKILILSGGEIEDSFLREVLERDTFDRILCADRGTACALRAGLVPDEVIGDFDSLPEEFLAEAKERFAKAHWTHLNPIKDATDTEEALDLALACHPSQIVILGATGTRIDHVLGNLSLLAKAKAAGTEAVILDAHNRIRLVEGDFLLRREEQFGTYLSLVPFGGPASGVTLEGVYYPLRDAVLTYGNSLGISNEIVSEEAKIHIGRGSLLLIESRD